MAGDRPFVSVAVCTRDRSASLLRCLLSVVDQGWPPDRMEFVVVDDASQDDTAELVEGLFNGLRPAGYARLHLLTHPEPLGAAEARSRSLLEAAPAADWILQLDDDAVLGPEALSRLVSGALSRPGVGAAGPRLVFLSRPDLLCQSANYFGRWTGLYRSADPPDTAECDWLNGTCCLLKAEAARKVLPIYEGYHRTHEDVELCLSMKEAGWRVLYVPAATAYHDAPLGLRPEGRHYYLYRNKAIVIRRHLAGARRWTALGLFFTLGLAKATVLALARGQLLELAPVLWAAFRDAALDRRGKA